MSKRELTLVFATAVVALVVFLAIYVLSGKVVFDGFDQPIPSVTPAPTPVVEEASVSAEPLKLESSPSATPSFSLPEGLE